jgi:hypothetical protein
MSLSQKNLSSIQKAGQAVHGACAVIAEAVRVQAESLVASVSSKPFDAESDQVIARFKSLSRLNQGLVAVEAQLQELYTVAAELANPASDVVIALPEPTKRAAANAAAVDAVVKSAKVRKVAAKTTKVKKIRRKVAGFTRNDTTLLQYLQGVLKSDEWVSQTGATMAAGSGIPLGSVGVSLKKIVSSGAVKAGERGKYQLGTSAATPVATVEPVRSAPAKVAKKAKSAAAPKANALKAKKVKSAPASASTPEAVAAEEVALV